MWSAAVLFSIASLLNCASGHPEPSTNTPSAKTIFKLNETGWLENIAVRSNGNLLATRLDKGQLWEIPPQQPSLARVITGFPHTVGGLLGITELTLDSFVVISCNYSSETLAPANGSWATYRVDFHQNSTTSITKLVEIPEALLLNGLTTLSTYPPIVLSSDSTAGQVFQIDISAKTYSISLEDESMKPTPGVPSAVGINGVRYHDNFLYYTNMNKYTFNRVRLTPDGTAAGPYTFLANVTFPDDFTLTKSGTVYVAGNGVNTLWKVPPKGLVSAVIGSVNETTLSKPTSAVFGRRRDDCGTLYLSEGSGSIVAVTLA